MLTMLASPAAIAQTYTVLHTFAGGSGGSNPTGSLTMDGAGNIYGSASNITYKLVHRGSGWTLNPLRTYTGGPDGENPWGGVVFGPDGALYGTTWLGGVGGTNCAGGCGVVFKLTPGTTAPRSVLTPWDETIVYPFQGEPVDGQNPAYGNLVFDASGAIYGTTEFGGSGEYGTVFKLTPSANGWTESVLYHFNNADGALPSYGVVFDDQGNMYGTTELGGAYGWGEVYELSPLGSVYAETVLHNFLGPEDGKGPVGLIRDSAGNLYGTTQTEGLEGAGTVFEFTYLDGSWQFNVLYSFYGGDGPSALLTLDAAGNLYGTTVGTGSYGWGVVFELSPSGSGWTYTVLHEFTGGADGGEPRSQILIDSSGNLFGTAYIGGDSSLCNGYGCGVVWEITPQGRSTATSFR